MSLKLNTSRDAYQEFYGRNTEKMQELVADGRVPISVAGLMQRRLDVRNSDDKVKSAWMDNYFDTGDAVVYHPDGRVKIVLDSEDLRNMTPDTPRNGGALIVTPEAYDALQGEELKKGKLGKTGDWMSRDDVKAHPVWKVLARDQVLLNDYADHIFGEYQARFAKGTPLEDVRAMGVFPGSTNGDTPEIFDKKAVTQKDFQEGIAVYHLKELAEAKQLFKKCLSVFPEDKAAEIYQTL